MMFQGSIRIDEIRTRDKVHIAASIPTETGIYGIMELNLDWIPHRPRYRRLAEQEPVSTKRII